MTRLSVFIATSLDGYIADSDGGLDWLDEAATGSEDYGWSAFMDGVDALAMGRGTYDHIRHLDPLPFGDRPVYVFTGRPPQPRAGVSFWQATPTQAVREWARYARVYVDGGRLISSFLAEGLIDDMTITTAPVLLGAGIPLFHALPGPTRLRLEDVSVWPDGFVTRRYARATPHSEQQSRESGADVMTVRRR